MENILINIDERIDDLHRNGYKIIQNSKKFCFGTDAVLLSDFSKVKKNDKVLDLCTGGGIIPILMESKNPSASYVGIEIQDESSNLAIRSVALNNLSNKIKIINDDLKNITNYYEQGFFDVITCNPPYMSIGNGEINISSEKAIARHEIKCTINDILFNGGKVLKFGGNFYLIHRPNRLVDVFNAMRQNSIEPKSIRFVTKKIDTEPFLVLIKGVKCGQPGLSVLPILIIYNDKNNYTDETNKIYYK